MSKSFKRIGVGTGNSTPCGPVAHYWLAFGKDFYGSIWQKYLRVCHMIRCNSRNVGATFLLTHFIPESQLIMSGIKKKKTEKLAFFALCFLKHTTVFEYSTLQINRATNSHKGLTALIPSWGTSQWMGYTALDPTTWLFTTSLHCHIEEWASMHMKGTRKPYLNHDRCHAMCRVTQAHPHIMYIRNWRPRMF